MKMILFLLSTLPCSLICADNVWLCLLGIAYTGVWLWIANECINAYGRKNRADTDGD